MKQYKYLVNLKIKQKLARAKLTSGLVDEIQRELAFLLERKRTTLEKGLRTSSPVDYFHLQDIEEAIDMLNGRVLTYYSPMVLH